MKAIIMAGGEGKRLKPVSGDKPKPLVGLCGKPVMEHIILLLKKHGITDICASLKYRPDDITEYFGDGSRLGVRLCYRIEETALGTAGGVKNCEDFYGGEDFLVISGDAACDFDLSVLMAEHERVAPAVTLALYPHPEPLRYGLALCDRESRIRTFIEKPDWSRVVTNLVNTGIYIVSPRAMELVPGNTEFDFAKDLFPKLLAADEKLLGCPLDGYWCDIGTPKSYYECCIDALSGRLDIELSGGFEETACDKPQDREPEGMESCEVRCNDRARLMGKLSSAFIELGADCSDGFCLKGEDYELRISPVSSAAALRISANAADAETARELTESAAALVREFNRRMDDM